LLKIAPIGFSDYWCTLTFKKGEMMDEAKGRVLVGVTGCIAAYKACELVRAMQKRGYEVRVVMTEHATHLVGSSTFRALTGAPVGLELFDAAGDPIHHISLAQWADVFVVAPATANVVAKIACGIADDLLTTTALACAAPLVIAPAMNTAMYDATATQENLSRLITRGVRIVEPSVGRLACGDTGRGHLADVEEIADAVELAVNQDNACNNSHTDDNYLLVDGVKAKASSPSPSLMFERVRMEGEGLLAGRRVLVTSGRTEEPIDPVRFISNRSSGKMGEALALAAIDEGADVTVITGPADIEYPAECVVHHIKTAREMHTAALEAQAAADIIICAAAVADFRPHVEAGQKIKKSAEGGVEALSSIKLVENPDVLASLAEARRPGQVIVGFAAETSDVLQGARAKLVSKGADFIVANEVGDGVTFGQDEVRATLVGRDSEEEFPEMTKYAFARTLISKLAQFLG
jgi:phosphopantothenoylcysteine decarboxylase/phosphopantothenate--cysteine ligase